MGCPSTSFSIGWRLTVTSKFRWTRDVIILAAGIGGPLLTSALDAQPPQPPPPPLPVLEQNRDSLGFIKVHEQGTVNVKVTSGSLNVGGAVSVTNFPATQNVFVTGGTLDSASLTPVTQIHALDVNLQPGQSSGQITLSTTLNAVAVAAGSLREGGITFYSRCRAALLFSVFLSGRVAAGDRT
jgi:hypothetical protein